MLLLGTLAMSFQFCNSQALGILRRTGTPWYHYACKGGGNIFHFISTLWALPPASPKWPPWAPTWPVEALHKLPWRTYLFPTCSPWSLPGEAMSHWHRPFLVVTGWNQVHQLKQGLGSPVALRSSIQIFPKTRDFVILWAFLTWRIYWPRGHYLVKEQWIQKRSFAAFHMCQIPSSSALFRLHCPFPFNFATGLFTAVPSLTGKLKRQEHNIFNPFLFADLYAFPQWRYLKNRLGFTPVE